MKSHIYQRKKKHVWAKNWIHAPFIAGEAQHHVESRITYGPFESTLLDQGFPIKHELDAFNPPLTGTLLCRL